MPDQDVTYWDRSIKGAVPSDKLGRMVHYRGLIARGVIYLLEHDARVESYTKQPCTIRYLLDDSELSYAPDFLVTWYERKSSLLECKTETYVRDPKHTPQWTAAQLWCDRHDWDFILISGTALRECSTLFSNLELLALHAHQILPPPPVQNVRIHGEHIFCGKGGGTNALAQPKSYQILSLEPAV